MPMSARDRYPNCRQHHFATWRERARAAACDAAHELIDRTACASDDHDVALNHG